MPARERLSYEQAERVRTAQLATEPRRKRSVPQALPWIVVGAVAVIAIVVCIVLVNLARGGDSAPAKSASPSASESPSTTPSASADANAATSGDDEQDADADADKDKEKDKDKDKDTVPKVDVGSTNQLDIPAWGATSQLSQKFGMTSYNIPDNVNLRLSSPLIDSLPDSCAAMRTQWGVTQQADGKYAVLKPAETCAAAPELYDELWGLTDAFAKSVKPVG